MRIPLFVKIAYVAGHGNCYAAQDGKGRVAQCKVDHRRRRHVPPVLLLTGMHETMLKRIESKAN